MAQGQRKWRSVTYFSTTKGYGVLLQLIFTYHYLIKLQYFGGTGDVSMQVMEEDWHTGTFEYVPISVTQSHGRSDPYRFEFSGFVELDNTSEYQ